MSERRVATGKALRHITKGNFESPLGPSSLLTTYFIRSKTGTHPGTRVATFFETLKFFDMKLSRIKQHVNVVDEFVVIYF